VSNELSFDIFFYDTIVYIIYLNIHHIFANFDGLLKKRCDAVEYEPGIVTEKKICYFAASYNLLLLYEF